MSTAASARSQAGTAAPSRPPLAVLVLGLVCLLLPLSSATKALFGLSDDLPWIDPPLLLAPLLLLCLPRARMTLAALLVLTAALLATLHGALLAGLTLGGQQAPYDLVREPFKLTLCLLLFVGIAHFARTRPALVVRFIHLSVLLQLAFAALVWLGSSRILTLPGALGPYAVDLGNRQALWLDSGAVARFAGTFPESPPFGLFMLSCFFIFYAACHLPGLRRITRSGLVASGLGAALSLSDQVVIALGVFLTWWLLKTFWHALRRRSARLLLLLLPVALLCGSGLYSAQRVLAKVSEVGLSGPGVVATSGGERSFHARYALTLLGDQPTAVLLGIGPGRYGEYAVRTGIFPQTVTMQVTPVEWWVEYGALGLAAVIFFLFVVWKSSRRVLGSAASVVLLSLLLGILFQASWKWSGWFVALAFLYGLGQREASLKICSPRDTPARKR